MIKRPNISVRGIIAGGIALVLLIALGFGVHYFLHLKNAPPLKLDMGAVDTHKAHEDVADDASKNTKNDEHGIANNKAVASAQASQKQGEQMNTAQAHSTAHEKQASADKEPLVCLPAPKGLTLIVRGLGLDAVITDRAIRELPSYVVLSFSAYAKMLNQWMHPSKAAGHTILIELGSEKDLESFGLITYFDGILMTSGKAPVPNQKALTDFIVTVSDMQKILVEGRLLLENPMLKEAEKQNFPVHRVVQSLSQDTIFLDKQDILSQKGIITIPASLVPYLIDYLNEKSPKESVFGGF